MLVTAKPRPPSLMTTGAPLPSSYPGQLGSVGIGSDEDGDEGEEGEEGEEADDGDGGDDDGGSNVDESAAARFVEMGSRLGKFSLALQGFLYL